MTSVPRTVPSKPLSLIASRRQIIRTEAATKSARNHQGAQAPVLSIHVMSDLKGRSLARGQGRAKAVLGSGPAQFRGHLFRAEAVEHNRLVARGVAADNVHSVARAVQLLREYPQQGLVSRG